MTKLGWRQFWHALQKWLLSSHPWPNMNNQWTIWKKNKHAIIHWQQFYDLSFRFSFRDLVLNPGILFFFFFFFFNSHCIKKKKKKKNPITVNENTFYDTIFCINYSYGNVNLQLGCGRRKGHFITLLSFFFSSLIEYEQWTLWTYLALILH